MSWDWIVALFTIPPLGKAVVCTQHTNNHDVDIHDV
jgi:hypothetical protein